MKPEPRIIKNYLSLESREETSFDGHRADYDWIQIESYPDNRKGLQQARAKAAEFPYKRLRILRVLDTLTELPLVSSTRRKR